MHSFGLWRVGDLKTYHFQSIFVGKVAMEVWVGGEKFWRQVDIVKNGEEWGGWLSKPV